MILSDNELQARLPDFQIEADNPNFPFEAKTQIQPCSIDLRLSDVVWIPKGLRTLDLSDQTPLGPQISRAFERRKIAFPKGFQLRPGGFVLGRTYERFVIPRDLMGRLAGRTSLGRLGLSVASLSNFINPGWEGHMPLMLINHSPYSIRIHPYLGIVQLCFFQMTSPATNTYGTPQLESKYLDDDGGPSRYWRDISIAALRENLDLQKSSPGTREFLERLSQRLDEPTRQRLAECLKKTKVVPSPSEIAQDFVRREQRRNALLTLALIVVGVPIAVLVSWLPSFLTEGLAAVFGSAVLAILAVVLLAGIYRFQVASSIGPSELRQIVRELLDGK